LSKLDVKLDGEQLTISPREDALITGVSSKQIVSSPASKPPKAASDAASFSFSGEASQATEKQSKPIALQKKAMGEVPEIPLPDRGATLGKFSKVSNP
jgi:ubiquitin thioesterase OTU1